MSGPCFERTETGLVAELHPAFGLSSLIADSTAESMSFAAFAAGLMSLVAVVTMGLPGVVFAIVGWVLVPLLAVVAGFVAKSLHHPLLLSIENGQVRLARNGRTLYAGRLHETQLTTMWLGPFNNELRIGSEGQQESYLTQTVYRECELLVKVFETMQIEHGEASEVPDALRKRVAIQQKA